MTSINDIKSNQMRVKEFFIRTGLFLPMAIFGILILLMIFGIVADLLGADDMFYCTQYCKISIGVLAAGAAIVLYCQARACWRK